MKTVPFDAVPLAEAPLRSDADQTLLRKGCQFIRDIGTKIG